MAGPLSNAERCHQARYLPGNQEFHSPLWGISHCKGDFMAITVDELIESAATGVLRTMNARAQGEKSAAAHDAASLVQAGLVLTFTFAPAGYGLFHFPPLRLPAI